MLEMIWYLCVVPFLILSIVVYAFSQGQRKFIFWRADGKCEDCDADWNDGVMLEAHHVKPTHEGGANDVSNGKLLCRPDHAKAHDKLAHQANQRGDKETASKNAYAARQIRKRSKWRWGHGDQ